MSTRNDELLQTTSRLRVGLIGDPVAHSLSPRIPASCVRCSQDSGFLRTVAYTCPKATRSSVYPCLCVQEVLRSQRRGRCPHKPAVYAAGAKVDPLTTRIGAVNTIVHRDNYLHGYNTDAPGLINALHEYGIGTVQADGKISLRGYTVILLGAGGAAPGAAFATAEAGVERLIILNRHLEHAQLLAEEVQLYYDRPAFSLNDPSFLISHPGSIIINATPLGMHSDVSPLPADALARFDPNTFIYDMIYNPSQTYLLCQARTMGFRTANGLSMLLHQGALSFTWSTEPDLHHWK